VLEQLQRGDLPLYLRRPSHQHHNNRTWMSKRKSIAIDQNESRWTRTCSSIFIARMRWRSRILMAKARPVSACRASLTLPKWPSPSVRPISYFPIRIPPPPAVAPPRWRSPAAVSTNARLSAGGRASQGSKTLSRARGELEALRRPGLGKWNRRDVELAGGQARGGPEADRPV
jgi:hypothetical protein